MSSPFTLYITLPLITKAGKTAYNRKYAVQSVHGKRYTLGEFAKGADLSMCAIISRTKSWPPGVYHEPFVKLIVAMKHNRKQRKYEKRAHSVCAHCGLPQTRSQGVAARRAYQALTKAAKPVAPPVAPPEVELSLEEQARLAQLRADARAELGLPPEETTHDQPIAGAGEASARPA